MPISIGKNRVAFGVVVDHRTLDPDGTVVETKHVSPDSTTINLSAHKLRAIVTPAGHSLGVITVTTSDLGEPPEFVDVEVPIPALVDDDDAATTLFLGADWPLLNTRFHVEHPRDDAFEVFLITEPR